MAFLIMAKTPPMEVQQASLPAIDYYLNESQTGWTTDQSAAFQTNSWPEVEKIFDEYEKEFTQYETRHKPLGPHLKTVFSMGGKLLIVESALSTVKTRMLMK